MKFVGSFFVKLMTLIRARPVTSAAVAAGTGAVAGSTASSVSRQIGAFTPALIIGAVVVAILLLSRQGTTYYMNRSPYELFR